MKRLMYVVSVAVGMMTVSAATARADAAVEKLHQAVRQMKADGLTAETIAKYTGMTAADVDGLC